MNTKIVLCMVAFSLLILLAACAPGPNEFVNTPNEEGETDGFLAGLWHGIITPVTFLISLFNKNVHFYEVHNNGGWYNFGYILGLLISIGGSGGGAGRSSKH